VCEERLPFLNSSTNLLLIAQSLMRAIGAACVFPTRWLSRGPDLRYDPKSTGPKSTGPRGNKVDNSSPLLPVPIVIQLAINAVV
jgi:hypothetical protein